MGSGFAKAKNLTPRTNPQSFQGLGEEGLKMLAKAREHLREGGLVYVELPDGKAAQLEGPDREEFAIDHHHIFSLKSFSILATKAGFQVLVIEQVHEPSTKYTLRAFLRNAEEGAS